MSSSSSQPKPQQRPQRRWNQKFRFLPILIGLVLFILSLWVISQQIQQYRIQDIIQSITSIPAQHVGLAIALTILNYFMLTGYDTLAVRFVRHPLPYPKTALVSAISYAISNTVGFTLFSGGAIRYRFYSAWGLSAPKIAQIIVFCNLSFWLGLLTVGGVLFLVEPLDVPDLLHLPFRSVHPLGWLFLALVLCYLIWNAGLGKSLRIKNWVLPHLSLKLSLAQIVITSLDWSLAVGVLYTLLPATPSLSYSGFFSIYLLAMFSGLLSNVPGGLGVFETVMLLLLAPKVNSASLLGALLAYRGIYFFLPLAIALLLFGGYEIRQRLKLSKSL